MLSYPALFHKEEDGTYWVEFPDVDGCFSMGDDIEHTKKMAQEALSLHIASLISDGQEVPQPSKREGENVYLIHPKRKVLFSLSLRKTRRDLGLTQAKMALRLGFTQQYLNELENPLKGNNVTLDKIDQIELALGRELAD